MFYRASHLGFVLAVATDGDEGELDEQRPTTLRVTSISSEDDHHLRVAEFSSTSLFNAIAAAQMEFGFEAATFCGPDGRVSRLYIQSADILAALSERGDDAVTFHAKLIGRQLSLLPNDDDPDEDYIRLMEVVFPDKSSVVFKGENLTACIESVRRNFVVHSVVLEQHDRKHHQSPWREVNRRMTQ